MDYSLPETNLIQIKTMEKVENKGYFVIEPLPPGYGVTIGNSLRRVLLSSLEGAAITSVKIEGVPHEFATIPGVTEDIVEIILNLKTLRFEMHSDEPVSLKINLKGPKEVKASDFSTNAQCHVINGETHLATLGKQAKLNLEIVVEKGRGYIPVELRKEEKLPLGTIAVDSVFTPVKKVHYEVENTRVGGQTNFDKLNFEVTTDGSIEPEIALKKSAQILIEHFSLIQNAFSEEKTKVETPKKIKVTKAKAKVSKKVKSKK